MMLSQQLAGWRYVEWRIVRVKGRRAESKRAVSRVQSVWSSGLRFYSELRLPVGRDVAIRFVYTTDGRRREREGTIRQCVQLENGYLYEAVFEQAGEDELRAETDGAAHRAAVHSEQRSGQKAALQHAFMPGLHGVAHVFL